jgi:hypothetical protein
VADLTAKGVTFVEVDGAAFAAKAKEAVLANVKPEIKAEVEAAVRRQVQLTPCAPGPDSTPGPASPLFVRGAQCPKTDCRTGSCISHGQAGLARGCRFGLLMLAVVLQLLGRSGWIAAPIWTEELSRFCLLYLAAFGAGLAFRSGDMVNVDLISEALPGPWPWRLRLLSAAVRPGFVRSCCRRRGSIPRSECARPRLLLGIRMDFHSRFGSGDAGSRWVCSPPCACWRC